MNSWDSSEPMKAAGDKARDLVIIRQALAAEVPAPDSLVAAIRNRLANEPAHQSSRRER